MMNATFTIPLSEFNTDLIEKIRGLFVGREHTDAEIYIAVRDRSQIVKKETREGYLNRVEEALAEIDQKTERVVFTFEEFEKAFPSK